MAADARSDRCPLAGADILVVEDDFLLLLDLEQILTAAGARHVATARSLRESRHLVEANEFNAAVLDVRIGRESIVPLAQQLHAVGVPFLFYTGQSSDELPVIAETAPPRVVSKPAQPRALVAAVAGLLAR